jgi:hypothetical protein
VVNRIAELAEATHVGGAVEAGPTGIAAVDVGEAIGAHRRHGDAVLRLELADSAAFEQLHWPCLLVKAKILANRR